MRSRWAEKPKVLTPTWALSPEIPERSRHRSSTNVWRRQLWDFDEGSGGIPADWLEALRGRELVESILGRLQWRAE